ncbi:MAG TPA: class I SAM-dependent methyltransferase [Mycobacteriales bacterium]|nr:class I SAM-dependent methyltransferase [Mycobacteriales bacterium]
METTLEMLAEETAANGGDAQRRDALAERLFASLLGGMELLSVDVGRRLGLYAALRERDGVTAAELAVRAGVAQRYAREWLEQQAVAGIVDVDDPDLPAAQRRYRLPEGHAAVLVDADSPAYLQGAPPSLIGLARTLGAVVDAYRTGDGVRYADFGADIRHGIGAFNRPMFVNELPTWLRALPDVHDRLTRGGRVLDVGCGTAWSSIALAQHFPRVTVHAIDLDEASIEEARVNAREAGVADRITFEVLDAAEFEAGRFEPAERFELACVFEALHDMGSPVEALARIRAALAPHGAVLVGAERVADAFVAPGDEIERFMYAWSVLHCLPATGAESPDVANGTVLRQQTVHTWAREAGFGRIATLPLDNDFWRFYRFDEGR